VKKEIGMSPSKGSTKKSTGFSAEEKAAARARVKELKEAANKADEEKAALAAIEALQEPDRSLAKRLHALIQASAPGLSPKTWYGMPAYAQDGSLICYFQSAQKFKTRYATLGFSDKANLDEGAMWPVVYALKGLTAAEEARIAALLKKAVS